MPVKVKLPFFPEKPIEANRIFPETIHGLFFNILPEDMVKELHPHSRVKPFSLWSNVPFFKEGKVEKIVIEISFLKEEFLPKLLASYLLGNEEISLNGIKLTKGVRPYFKREFLKSYGNIYEYAPAENTIVLDFLTPTTFKKGDFDYPLPEPSLVFKSLIRKWVAFSNYPLTENLREILEKGIFISGAWIKTVKFPLSPQAKIVGFTGRVVFYIDSSKKEILKWLNTLAFFGEYAGIGRKTTMGLGKVRFIRGNNKSP